MRNPLSEKDYSKRTKNRREDIRGYYFRDQTAIIHSMAYRRLKHKTQVFFSPENDHICTRIEHVQHVATIASTICKGLINKGWELDMEMAYAIGLGHDVGHAPFGHAGEEALKKCIKQPFMHEINSYRVVEKLANNGEGLNLTYGVKDGIICHNGERFEQELIPSPNIKELNLINDRSETPNSIEGCIVRFSDKIAYLGRDIEDAILLGVISPKDIPQEVRKALGRKNGELIDNLVIDIIQTSQSSIKFSDAKFELINKLKNFNYDRIYNHQNIKEYKIYIEKMIRNLYDYLENLLTKNSNDIEKYNKETTIFARNFGSYLNKMDKFYDLNSGINSTEILQDYIGGMTDDYAIKCITEITIPTPLFYK
jgi:dGTPase